MQTTILSVVGVVVLGVLAFCLVVLPFRISKGLLHKWGYHAHCGKAREVGQTADNIRLRLLEESKKGMQQETRAASSSGPERFGTSCTSSIWLQTMR